MRMLNQHFHCGRLLRECASLRARPRLHHRKLRASAGTPDQQCACAAGAAPNGPEARSSPQKKTHGQCACHEPATEACRMRQTRGAASSGAWGARERPSAAKKVALTELNVSKWDGMIFIKSTGNNKQGCDGIDWTQHTPTPGSQLSLRVVDVSHTL